MVIRGFWFDEDKVSDEAVHSTWNYCAVPLVGAAAFVIALIAPAEYMRSGAGGAVAAQKQFSTDAVKTTLRRVSGLETQVQRITVEMAQIALNLDKSASVVRLQKAYNQFERNLSMLVRGDATIGIPAPSDPAIKGVLGDVQVAWNIFRSNVLQTILEKDVSRTNLFILAELDQTVIAATTHAKKVYRERFLSQKMVSLSTLTLIKAERQSYLAGKIAAEVWLIALNYEVPRLRPRLAENIKLFSRVLKGLSKGDPELQLFQIDDPSLQAALRRTQSVWDRVLPHVDAVVTGRGLPVDSHERVKGDMEKLRDNMEKVVDVLARL